MLYPEKISAKRSNLIVKILLLSSLILAVVLVLINKVAKPNIPWAALANAGIIYIWVTVKYSVNQNKNIAKYVLLQAVAVSALAWYIDYRLGFKGWSIRIAIPIIIATANITMFVLTIIGRKKYINYAMYQIIIIILSILPPIVTLRNPLQNSKLAMIATSISVVNFVLSLILCGRDFKEIIVRKFHT